MAAKPKNVIQHGIRDKKINEKTHRNYSLNGLTFNFDDDAVESVSMGETSRFCDIVVAGDKHGFNYLSNGG